MSARSHTPQPAGGLSNGVAVRCKRQWHALHRLVMRARSSQLSRAPPACRTVPPPVRRYEEYLDSQINATDMYYLENVELARHLVELGCGAKLLAHALGRTAALGNAGGRRVARRASHADLRPRPSLAPLPAAPQHLDPLPPRAASAAAARSCGARSLRRARRRPRRRGARGWTGGPSSCPARARTSAAARCCRRWASGRRRCATESCAPSCSCATPTRAARRCARPRRMHTRRRANCAPGANAPTKGTAVRRPAHTRPAAQAWGDGTCRVCARRTPAGKPACAPMPPASMCPHAPPMRAGQRLH